MNRPARVYVNSAPVDVEASATALDAVRVWDAAVALELAAGARALADSRGLPVALDAPVYTGAIFRVTAARRRGPDDPTEA